MAVKFSTLILTLVLLCCVFCSVSSTPSTTKIVNGFVSGAVNKLMKWVWSLKASTKTVISGRPMMKFESGYTVETVFDGSKLGIEPYSVGIMSSGELLILDSANSNLYKISSSLSQYTRPRLVAGSADGYSGHVDGKLREARMNHPKGLTVDDRGNIYIADTDNMELLCFLAAGFFGYMLSLLQRRVGTMVSPEENTSIFTHQYETPVKSSVRPPLIPTEGEVEKQEESMFGSLGKLITRTGAVLEILGGVFPMFKRFPLNHQYQHRHQQHQQQQYQQHTWPVQDSFLIPKEDEPPSFEARTPTPRKTYAFMSKDSEKMLQLKQSHAFYGGGWNSDFQQQQQQTQQSPDNTKEVVFGEIQEQGQRDTVIIRPLDHANPVYDRHNVRSRFKSAGYSQGY
ncbi:unnamed protein product [Withania somnifera]